MDFLHRYVYLLRNFSSDETRQNRFREIVRDAVTNLGLQKLIYADGRTILKEAPGLTFDLVHPSPAGMEQIAENLFQIIQGKRNPLPLNP